MSSTLSAGPRSTRSSTRWVVALTGIGSLMGALDTVVVSTALTTIHAHLHASVAELEWTVNGYSLSFAVLLVAGAVLGDRFGRRRLYALGLVLFAASSAACAVSPNVAWLITARVVQGAGAALLVPLSLTLLSAAFPPERRGAAIGIFSAITGISVAAGPLVGGAVTQGLEWQWIFWLNVPIGLVTAVLVLAKLPESHGPKTGLDVRGLALVTGGALGIVWALVRGNDAGWSSSEVVAALSVGVLCTVAFILWERRTPNAMMPMRLFRSRGFSAGNMAMFCTFASLFSAVFFFAQFLQNGLGYSPLGTGLRLLPWTATFITIAPIAGTFANRIGERTLMTTGLVLQGAGMAWLASVAVTGLSYSSMLGPFIMAGIGVSMAIPAAQNSVVGSVHDDDLGKASGANSMMREMGGVFGIAVAVAVFAANGSYHSPAHFINGFGPAIEASAGFSLLGAVAAAFLPGRRSVPVPSATKATFTSELMPEPVG
jgi:EmrB/QacA subfamily drug resistance transporter